MVIGVIESVHLGHSFDKSRYYQNMTGEGEILAAKFVGFDPLWDSNEIQEAE